VLDGVLFADIDAVEGVTQLPKRQCCKAIEQISNG
jgi:hypothetical protein